MIRSGGLPTVRLGGPSIYDTIRGGISSVPVAKPPKVGTYKKGNLKMPAAVPLKDINQPVQKPVKKQTIRDTPKQAIHVVDETTAKAQGAVKKQAKDFGLTWFLPGVDDKFGVNNLVSKDNMREKGHGYGLVEGADDVEHDQREPVDREAEELEEEAHAAVEHANKIRAKNVKARKAYRAEVAARNEKAEAMRDRNLQKQAIRAMKVHRHEDREHVETLEANRADYAAYLKNEPKRAAADAEAVRQMREDMRLDNLERQAAKPHAAKVNRRSLEAIKTTAAQNKVKRTAREAREARVAAGRSTPPQQPRAAAADPPSASSTVTFHDAHEHQEHEDSPPPPTLSATARTAPAHRHADRPPVAKTVPHVHREQFASYVKQATGHAIQTDAAGRWRRMVPGKSGMVMDRATLSNAEVNALIDKFEQGNAAGPSRRR